MRVGLRRGESVDATRERALTHRIAALVLEHPDEELIARLPELRQATATLPDILGSPLSGVLDHLEGTPVMQLAADYADTFDLRRRCCLYLTYYAHGDTRKRGVALLEMKQAYRRSGVELSDEELSDHLCVLLEFAATVDPRSGVRQLEKHRAGLELLRLALIDAGSPYAGAVIAVSATLSPLAGSDREAVARLAAEGPPGEDVGLEAFAPPDYMGARR